MRYLGGKTRIAKQLAVEIDKVRRPGQWVWDAFCGGLSMSVALSKNGPVYSTDACVPLIALYRAVQAGWDPPSEVTREQWTAAKSLPDTDPMKAFCGFGCSMSGAWFKAYAKDDIPGEPGFKSRFYARATRNGLLQDVPRCTALDTVSFLDVHPRELDGVLYLDPPYAGTAGYDGAPPFDHGRFVARVREWSAFAPVFVSEYDFPLGVEVWSREQKAWIRNSRGPAQIERLYYIAKGDPQ